MDFYGADVFEGWDDTVFLARGPLRTLETAGGFEVCDRTGEVVERTSDGVAAHWLRDFGNVVAMRAAAAQLVRKLEAVEPAINSAFTIAYIHGSKYDGPSYGVEVEELRRLL